MMDDGQGVLPGFEEAEAAAEGVSPEEARRVSAEARRAFEGADHPGRGELPWMGEYLTLRAEGWPWRVAVFIAWASVPRERRAPKTLGELASVLGLRSTRAIRRWRERNPEIDARVTVAVVEPLMRARADVIEALIESATTADHRSHADRKLALEMQRLYTPRQELDATVRQAGVFLPPVEADQDGREEADQDGREEADQDRSEDADQDGREGADEDESEGDGEGE
jgi:hypothetical protein